MEQRMPNWLMKRAELTPKRVALVFEDETYTFSQVFEEASNIAGQLNTIGINESTTAAVLLSNHKDSAMILYALQMLGVKTVILNSRLTTEELMWQINDSKASILVTEGEFKDQISMIEREMNGTVIEKEALFLITPENIVFQAEYELANVATIMYTSGTTGNPKGVLQTYGNHWWSATASALNLGLREDDCWLCVVPIFHISGYSILMRGLIYGIPVVLHRKFDAEKTIEDIKKHHVTIMSVVSTMLQRVSEELSEKNLPDYFRCMLLGGGPAALSMLEECKEKQIPVYQSFGMTETASQFATLAPEDSLTKLGSAGKALFPNQIKIVADNGESLPAKAEGEIIVKGPNVTPGYLNQEEETRQKIRDGWLYTGDIGYLDEDGFLYVLDRRSDLIISGGENIYPAEVEGVLTSHHDVDEAGVIGRSDDTWGQVPVAFVVLKNKEEVVENDLREYCEKKLAKYKVPKTFYFVDKLPRNASKKLLRKELRSWHEKEAYLS